MATSINTTPNKNVNFVCSSISTLQYSTFLQLHQSPVVQVRRLWTLFPFTSRISPAPIPRINNHELFFWKQMRCQAHIICLPITCCRNVSMISEARVWKNMNPWQLLALEIYAVLLNIPMMGSLSSRKILKVPYCLHGLKSKTFCFRIFLFVWRRIAVTICLFGIYVSLPRQCFEQLPKLLNRAQNLTKTAAHFYNLSILHYIKQVILTRTTCKKVILCSYFMQIVLHFDH